MTTDQGVLPYRMYDNVSSVEQKTSQQNCSELFTVIYVVILMPAIEKRDCVHQWECCLRSFPEQDAYPKCLP